jgi:nitroreductase
MYELLSAQELLLHRISNPKLIAPAPNDELIATICASAMAVPDHGALTPWHFTIVKGEASLKRLSDIFVKAVELENGDDIKISKAAKMPYRAPLIIIVSTQYQEHPKVPKQEQLVAAGCAAHAMQMSAYSLGYGAMWRTGDMAYNSLVKNELNITSDNDIVGFLYIGTPEKNMPPKLRKPAEGFITLL